MIRNKFKGGFLKKSKYPNQPGLEKRSSNKSRKSQKSKKSKASETSSYSSVKGDSDGEEKANPISPSRKK
jgi:hypothetical protein